MSESALPSPETVTIVLILTTVLHALALILTSFRLWFRCHLRRFWWDDFWAALALLCDAICLVVSWITAAPLDDPYINLESLPTPTLSRQAHIISFWMSILFYTCIIWCARISIVLSVVRIVPPARSVSMTICSVGVVFVCMWIYMLACKSVVCAVDKSWYDATIVRCLLPNWVALSEVLTDTLSDIILVALPFRLLWHVKLPSNQRIMVLSVFSTSILVTVASVIHTTYLILPPTFFGGVTAELEGAVSLIVCNLLVIVTFTYRVIRNGRDLTAGLSDKNTRSSNRLTTVDLEYSGGSHFTTTPSMPSDGTGSAFSGTRCTETDVSSLKFASMSDKDATFGSVLVTGGSVLPTLPASRDKSASPVIIRK